MNMIEIQKVTKKFDEKTILDAIDLQIPNGSAFALIGSNGAGKSTILRLLCGVYQPNDGKVLLDGKPIYNSPAEKQRIFFVPDETAQYHGFTVRSLADFYKAYYPRFSEELFERMLKAIPLPINESLMKFSKGMKRQAIAMIGIAAQPDVLLLDEAFDGLDPSMRIMIRKLLVDLMLEKGMTVVISSHNLTEVNEICDSAAMLHNGKIIFSSSLDEARSSVHKIQIAFSSDTKAITEDDFRNLGADVLSMKQNLSVYHLVVRGEEEQLRALFETLHPAVLDMIPLTLEEIFIHELEVLGYGNYVFENDEPVSQ